MLVVTRRPNEIEPNSVTPSVGRAFEARLEEAREFLARVITHEKPPMLEQDV
jgi:hypothetical protein